jgi:hypothetical protein
MKLCLRALFRVRDASAVADARVDGPPAPFPPRALAPEHRRQVLFVLEVVDLLADRYGFDPSTLVSPRTGGQLGPELARMRAALDAHADTAAEDGRCG